MKKPSATEAIKLIAALSAIVIMGCESAPVETGTTTTSSGSSTSDGTTPGGTTPGDGVTYTTISVAPASALHTSIGNFTVLEISPIAGYTYTWSLSDLGLGAVSPSTGSKVSYYTTTIPAVGSAVQTITVTGTKTGSTVGYKGTSTITHRAP